MKALLSLALVCCLFGNLSAQKFQLQDFEIVYADELKHVMAMELLPIGIEATTKDGEVVKTKGHLKGKMKWSEFDIAIQGGSLVGGKVRLAEVGKNYPNLTLEVTATHKGDPNLSKTIYIPLFKKKFRTEEECKCFDFGFLYGVGKTDVEIYVRDVVHPETGEQILAMLGTSKKSNNAILYFFDGTLGKIWINCNGKTGSKGADTDGVGKAGGDGGNGYNVDLYLAPGIGEKYGDNLVVSSDGGAGGKGGKGDIMYGRNGRDGKPGTIQVHEQDVDEKFREFFKKHGHEKSFIDFDSEKAQN